jgi:RHS repeat-associated protein
VVTLIDGWGNPVADQWIEALDSNGDVANADSTNSAGQVTLSVDDGGTYVFRVSYQFVYFQSTACDVPAGCNSATVQIEKPVQVTVTDGYGTPVAGQGVTAIDGEDNQVAWAVSDAAGLATIYLPPPGPYFFRAVSGNTYFDSAQAPDCGIPGCVAAAIAVTEVLVTVSGVDGRPAVGVTVSAVDTDGIEVNWLDTDAQGHSDIGVPAGAYKFRVHVNGDYAESGADGHCLVGGGCRTAAISVPTCTGRPDGDTCDDGDTCTQSETCQAGSCQAPANEPLIKNLVVADLGDLGGHNTLANYVNASGQAVGGGHVSSGQNHAFLTNAGGAIVDLGNQIGLPSPSNANAINDAGTIVGSMTASDGLHAFRYRPTGALDDLGTVSDGSTATDQIGATYHGSNAADVNAQGQVAGWFAKEGALHAFRYTDEVGFEDIGSLAGGLTIAWAINDSGTVGASSWVPGTPATFDVQRFGHAMVFDNDIVGPVDLNDLIDPALGWTLHAATDMAGDFVVGTGTLNGKLQAFRLRLSTGTIDEITNGWDGRSFGFGVNSAGDVVGNGYRDAAETDQECFVYSDRFGFKKLNDIVDRSTGWDLRSAAGIGESGDIVGWGHKGGNVSAFRVRLPAGGAAMCEARGVCGGSGDQICLFSDGVVETSPGHFVALFGYDNGSSSSVHPSVNEVRLDGNLVTTPLPAPPVDLSPGLNFGAYQPSFDAGHTISWTVNGETVTASASSSRGTDIVPTLVGIANNSAGVTKAIFTYTNASGTTINIPYRQPENMLSNQAGFIASPPEKPPQVFVTGDHAPFVATLGPNTLTWTVRNRSATASANSVHLSVSTLPDGTTVANLPDGRRVNLDSTPPQEAVAQPGPPVGPRFNGAPAGSMSVSPSGAALYTVPIAIPPGIAGMVPNLSLAYSSQGSDGIAGQGWSLGGLSAIGRCPRTRQQDGYGRPVMLDSLTASNNPDNKSDGICLDGKKLFELPAGSGNYTTESQDFNVITRTGTHFQVVTKAGEIRYYGRLNAANVQGAIWLLDRVVDPWGNYFDIHYNNDEGNGSPGLPNSFTASGIWVSRIDYTATLTNSTCNVDAPPASCFFAAITFEYECRPDIRWTRMASLRIPQSQRLKSITTPQGKYALTYTLPATQIQGQACPVGAGPSSLGVSQLESIGYCAGSQCMKPLNFGWQQPRSGSGWQKNPAYALPSFVGSGRGLTGTQLVDINGDGRADFILARTNGIGGHNVPQVATVLNTGSGWSSPLNGAGQTFPLYLADADDNPTTVRFADFDGDGRIDVMVDGANVNCDQGVCLSCPVGQGTCGSNTHFYGPAVWLNRFTPTGQGGWQFDPSYSGVSISFSGAVAPPTMVADVDGDGKADLVDFNILTSSNPTLTVYLNTLNAQGVHVWQPQQKTYTDQGLRTIFDIGITDTFHAADVNRDGLPDLVHDDFFKYQDGSVAATETVLINQGTNVNNSFWFNEPIVHSAPGGGTLLHVERPRLADIDGDGFHDAVLYAGTANQTADPDEAVAVGDGTGWGFGGAGAQYLTVLKLFTPPVGDRNPDDGSAAPEDYGWALVDIDGDGLADLVRNHWSRAPGGVFAGQGGGEILLNTGRTWLSVDPSHTAWQVPAGSGSIPAASYSSGGISGLSAFVDLDGDGMVDLLQEEEADTNLLPGAWINPYQRPLIEQFPNAIASPTVVTYVSTTSGSSTYSDDDTTEANTKPLAIPVTVVSAVRAEDGTGIGPLNTRTTTYTYHSLRQDSFGRGPLGFHRVEAFDQASQVRTETTYALAYPYTGMPIEVDKYQVVGSQEHLTNKTTTTYCDTLAANPVAPLGCGAVPAGKFPAGTVVFTSPQTITDVAYLHPETDDLVHTETITTSFHLDELGNATLTTTSMVKVEGDSAETFSKQVQNFYETSEAANEGKPTKTITTATGGTGPTTHTTRFEYSGVSVFGGVSPSRLALTKTRVEPDADWPVRLDTAYAYDQFGNVTTTTSCASDFDSCAAGATNPFASGATDPSDPSDPEHHPPFRTTTVSYDPSALGTAVSYGAGRFPAVTTNALGQSEATLYDPILGKVLRKTGPNGIETCYGYDPLGRQTIETDRCNSATPLITTTEYFSTLPRVSACNDPPCPPVATGFSPPNSAIVTVTTGPDGTPRWSYSDDQGKSTGTLAYAFDGGFIETTTAYNALGQVTQIAKPLHLATVDDQVTPSYTTTIYDEFNRVKTVTDPLGVIDGSGTPKITTISTTYNGSAIQTTRTVNGQIQLRLETKNAIGKVAAVTTQTEIGPATISYAYDADGNLTRTTDPGGNHVQVIYDARGRKNSTVDPDMGTWLYTQDGFGDLAEQTDAKGQTTKMIYDRLARVRTKTDATGTAEWLYDTAPGAGIGKLAAMVSAPDPNLGTCALPSGATVTGGQRAVKAFQFTPFGDLQEADECADGSPFETTFQYDAFGRQSLVRYPAVASGQLAVGYHYTSLGYLHYLTDESSDYSVLWQAKAMNALGQVTDEQMRNGVETISNRNPLTGWLLGSTATAHADQESAIQNWSYGFDEKGNLLSRSRTDVGSGTPATETFAYDLTDRLTSSVITTSAGSRTEGYAYDVLGNLTQKVDSAYTYGAGCQAGARAAGPHAVCTVAGGTPFVYDGNGNLTANGSRSATYNPSNKVTHLESAPAVSQGNDTGSVDFVYGADGNRVVQLVTNGGGTSRTVYVGLGATGKSLYERTTMTGAPTKHVHFIYAGGVHGGNAFALRALDVDNNGAATTNRYYSFDHLGSVTAMTDDTGRVVTAQSDAPNATVFGYDAWGARRNPDGSAADPASFNLPVGHREFTGQEQIPNVGLVNMNGRLYDPSLGRFLSPDPNVQFVANLQSYNRYSYAGNNPLRYTDPTGYFWSDVGNFWSGVGNWAKNYFSNPLNDFELATTAIVCTVGFGACVVAAVVFAAVNFGVAIAQGAPFDQTIINSSIGLGISLAMGGQNLGLTTWQSLALGASSSAFTTVMASAVSGRGISGYDLLGGIMLSAASSAAALGLQKAIAVSQATVAEAQGEGGSGEATVQELATTREMAEETAAAHGWDDGSGPLNVDQETLNEFAKGTSAEGRVRIDESMVGNPKRIMAATDIYGRVRINPEAFDSPGGLRAIIFHESIHVDQIAMVNRYRNLASAALLNEVEAYRASIAKFILSEEPGAQVERFDQMLTLSDMLAALQKLGGPYWQQATSYPYDYNLLQEDKCPKAACYLR